MYRIGEEEIEAVARVINSRRLFKTNGPETADCENLMREMLKVKYALLMTSGKAALISTLTALGIGPGDEVIVPGYTYIATAIAITAVGAIPVIAEIDETMTLSAAYVKRKISKYTKAIMPVHIQGFPCNMDALSAFGIPIVDMEVYRNFRELGKGNIDFRAIFDILKTAGYNGPLCEELDVAPVKNVESARNNYNYILGNY